MSTRIIVCRENKIIIYRNKMKSKITSQLEHPVIHLTTTKLINKRCFYLFGKDL